MNENERANARVAELRSERGPDPVPAKPPGVDVSHDEWKAAWFTVMNFCLRLTGSGADADDVRQEAYARLMTTRPFVRERQPSFVKHMILTASSIRKHDSKARGRRAATEADWGAEHKRERGETTAAAEQDVLEHAQNTRERERAARILAETRRRLTGHPLELRIIDHMEQAEANDEEFAKPAELSRALDVPVHNVYRALARIRRYKEGVYGAAGGTDQENE